MARYLTALKKGDCSFAATDIKQTKEKAAYLLLPHA